MCVKPGGAKIQLSRDEPAKKKLSREKVWEKKRVVVGVGEGEFFAI